MNQIVSCKELASALGRSRSYVQAMKKNGFQMASGRTTVDKALTWLNKHPKPFSKKPK